MRGPGAQVLLERALIASAAAAGTPVTVESAQATRWESATFSGARHVFEMRAATDGVIDRWLAALPEQDLPLRGHLVADLAVAAAAREAGQTRFRVEALTVAGP